MIVLQQDLTPSPDPGALLLGWAVQQEAGEPLEPFLLGGDLSFHGEPSAPYLLMGAWPGDRLAPPAPASGADFPWQPAGRAFLESLARFAAADEPAAKAGPWRAPLTVGWIGHELPASALARHREYLVIEPRAGRARLVAAGRPGDSEGAVAARLSRLVADVRSAAETGRRRLPAASARLLPPRFRAPVDAARHASRVRRILEAIAAGDVYQVNLAHALELEGFPRDPVGRAAAFLRLWRANPVPCPAYVQSGAGSVLAMSPERYLAWRPGLVESCPIKGTRPRAGDTGADRRLAAELAASAKDRAENVMIADLVRNDLGRVAVTGSVRVRALCAVQSFPGVHHLVSTVQGRPREGLGAAELLAAVHPAGSMTGAPKRRAVGVLAGLEGSPRGPYAGGIGWLAGSRHGHLAMVIRALLIDEAGARLPVGGGIVADSDPQAEYRETWDKAASLLRALTVVEALGEPAP